ncbi:hypothetical protein RRG08_048432 [Elysia crispata]|uniref:Uncharacterized protein n=1 Tax=Elysia crispata TaxID=231223 RepID=A0AAE1B950_9GAST|nr:hypothetical protein RRG08_048432 [Elysia crispata]
MAYPTLLWFAGYSNVSSVVIVVICFIIMAIFITLVSLNSDLSRTTQPLLGVEQRNMVKVVNPFFLQLEKQGKHLKDRSHRPSLISGTNLGESTPINQTTVVATKRRDYTSLQDT